MLNVMKLMIPNGKARTLKSQEFREEPLKFRKVLGPYLSRKSRLRCYYYAKTARGKWHRAGRIMHGMGWNYYLSYGKATPRISPLKKPKLPPIVNGIMKEYKIRRSIIFTPGEIRTEREKFRSWGDSAKKTWLAGFSNSHPAAIKPWNFTGRGTPLEAGPGLSEIKAGHPHSGKNEEGKQVPVKLEKSFLNQDQPSKPRKPESENIMKN